MGDVESFARSWGRHPFVRHAEPGFEHLVSVRSIEQWLAESARRPMFRMVQDGVTLPHADITRTARLGGQDVDDLADVERIAQRFAAGATLVVQNVEQALPPVRHLVTALTAELSHPVQANGYLTPPGATGLSPHTDTHDVLVLQAWGTKQWEIDGIGSFIAEPGDVVYIPTGTRHSAHTAEHSSLHLTIGILRITTRQVVRRLLASLADRLDDPLPIGFATGSVTDLAADLRVRLEGVVAELRSVDARALAEAEVARLHRHTRSPAVGTLSAVAGELELDQQTIVRVRRPDARLDVTDAAALVHLPGRMLRFPAVAAPALRHLWAAAECSIDELAGLDPSSRIVVARRLVREGAAEVVPALVYP